ncbi:hypothetical protein RhiirB3_435116 [Rhizophagus irregularis]|nr:hypothetical protein RhiirB3_435116 [Rhizophagus irregularis]
MEALFNCLFLNTDSLIPIPIYNNDNGLLREFLSDKKDAKNTSDMILWRRRNNRLKGYFKDELDTKNFVVSNIHIRHRFKPIDARSYLTTDTFSRGKTLEDTYQWRDYVDTTIQDVVKTDSLKPLVKTLNFINEKTPSIPSGMAQRYLGLRGDLNIAMWMTNTFHSIPVLAGEPEFLDEIERSLRHCINESDKKIYRSGLISNP